MPDKGKPETKGMRDIGTIRNDSQTTGDSAIRRPPPPRPTEKPKPPASDKKK
jgi:hypothetical protein